MPLDFLPAFTKKELRVVLGIFLACAAVGSLSGQTLPPEALLYPASGVALAGLFFGGLRLWPAATVGLFLGMILGGGSGPLTYVVPVVQTLQAVGGAYLLKLAGIDPLFRRFRDTFYVIATSLVVSIVTPVALLFIDMPPTWRWYYGYAATVCTFLAVSPFLLRSIAKLRFRRPTWEVLETVVIFAVLVSIDVALFSLGIVEILGILTLYFLLVPFFWIATRLRPRFVTLAVLITSGFALASAMSGSTAANLNDRLYSAELFLIVLSTVFYIIVSLEEDWRANTNLVRSQLATLENAVSRISSESQAKNDFIAILAHELRNPLAPVVSSIELMRIKNAKNHKDAEILETMENSMQTVRRLLDDLLDISRISEGKITVKHDTVDVGHVISRSIISTGHHYRERHQTLAFSGSQEPLCVAGDSVRLEQIFSNLLTNASKYSKSGDTVRLAVRKNGTIVEVTVANSGIGIPEDEIDTVFLPFHQLDSSKRGKKGLGIGLALVRSFVEMHSGTVEAKSGGTGKGSVFTVRLPLAEGKLAVKRKPRSRMARPERKTGPRILVVDDNDAAAAGIGRLLELQGCTVTYAYEGGQGIDSALREPRPEIVILDIGLQDQDGYTVAKVLRTQGFTGLLIALSGYSTPDALHRATLAGFDHYLVKPAGLAELQKVIPGLG